MEKARIIEILKDYNYWGVFNPRLIRRPAYYSKLEKMSKGNEIVIIKGIRRAGKSSLVNEFIRNRTLKDSQSGLIINLEDPRWGINMDSETLEGIYNAFVTFAPNEPAYVVLDEVQNVKNWERFARYLGEIKGVKTIVTGSSSSLLSEEYATVLTGRHLDIELFPLNFSEFLEFKGYKLPEKLDAEVNKKRIIAFLKEYLIFGGFPAVVLARDDERKTELLKSYFNDIATKDVAKRYKIKKLRELEALIHILISNISTVQSFGSLRKTLGISLDSVERFSRYLSIAGLIIFIDNFSYSTKAQVRSIKKVYSVDTGFYTSEGFKFSDNTGKLMENTVAIELQRHVQLHSQSSVFYYRKDYEIDFVVKIHSKTVQLMQVTYASSKADISEREINALVKGAKDLNCRNLSIITWDYEADAKVGEEMIHFIPLWKFLLK